MYVNNIEPEMFLPPGSESFNHNATRTTSSRSRSNNVNNNIVPVYLERENLLALDVLQVCLSVVGLGGNIIKLQIVKVIENRTPERLKPMSTA